MSFLTLAGLLVTLLVAAPIAAHLLRRRRAEERAFPPARLVPPTPPAARRRSQLEDRALFGVRSLAVITLALLGATPFLKCSRLALARHGGASVAIAIVLDDSLSMHATMTGGPARKGAVTKFDRALGAARELVRGLGPGDAVAIVLAGAPARVALASTPNTAAALAALDGIGASDRATDLDGAIHIARDLLRGMAQIDRRVVLLSDLADGAPDAPPLASADGIALWTPLPELETRAEDCAVVRADRAGNKVFARVVCARTGDADAGSSVTAPPRSLELRAGTTVLASAALTSGALRGEVIGIDVPTNASEVLHVALTGEDAIAEDDDAPVATAGGALPIAVVADAATTHVATGGPPPVEQALAALELDAQVHPLPTVPEHGEELDQYAALVVDDAPGFTPEVRRALAAWVGRGGVLLLALGSRAASAPLGMGFDPLVPGVLRWGASPAEGIDVASASALGPSASSLAKLGARGRTSFEAEALTSATVEATWTDRAPFLLRRAQGRGAVFALALPFGTEESDLALRPAFLALLDRIVSSARARGGARRIDVGEPWSFDGFGDVSIERVSIAGPGPREPLRVLATDGRRRAIPERAGLYELKLDGETSTRIAAVSEREIDLRPRRVLDEARSLSMGGVASTLDASPYLALALLALVAGEMMLRVWTARSAKARDATS